MRFDIVTIFPEFFQVLDISLLGKAQKRGIVEATVHDLRDWTEDNHRTVDDTPYGGGAGMVMRPDVWDRALKDIIKPAVGGKKPILAVPTPSGTVLTQELAQELAQRGNQLVFACGRYEGIDYRLVEAYQDNPEVEVLEFSLGDYVLNGGEVAALVLIESVARLLEGMVGNPQSLLEESHCEQGLLEYPVYTKPPLWEGREVPEVLRGGNHALIKRWQRNTSLERTLSRRPELILALNPQDLDSEDRVFLASQGICVDNKGRWQELRYEVFDNPDDEEKIAALAQKAGEWFPAACPSELPESAIKEFIAQKLNPTQITKHVGNPRHLVLTVQTRPWGSQQDWEISGWALVVAPLDSEEHEEEKLRNPGAKEREKYGYPCAYLSKFYLASAYRGSGLALAFCQEILAQTQDHYPESEKMVLGTNDANKRALKFYRKCGFKKAGRRVFYVGEIKNYDTLMVREFTK